MRNLKTYITNMQMDLKKLGYDLDTDGIFGRETESNVKQFQRTYRLEADGLFGRGSKQKLWELVGKKA